jgi:glycosyltransferase involved in cell wall biosynthesis
VAPRPLRVLYLHQYFITRAGVGGTRSYEFARFLAERGHEVTIVTAASAGERTGGRGARRRIDGIDVVEARAGYSDYMSGTKLGYPRRMLAFGEFALAASLAATRLPRPDVVFATSPPLTLALPAIAASIRHRTPLVFEVRDLWPEAPIQMGALRNPVLVRLARWLERAAYRASTHVVALSPGMREGVLAAGVPPERVTTIPNASDLDLFSPSVDGSEVRQRLGIEDRFVCSYFGAMGEANDLSQVIEAAELLRERGDTRAVFVLHGEGKRRAELEARSRELPNVIFSDPVPDKRAVASLAAASDACMTIYKDVPVLYTCSPNKLFDTFAAGRAAVVNTPGWLKELVEENEAGVFARPGEPGHLAERVSFLCDHPELVEAYGRNARALAERCFARDRLAERLLTVLREAAGE